MKISVEHWEKEENEIVLRCRELDQETLHVLALLHSQIQKFCAWNDRKEIVFLTPREILYAESVDDKTFLYGRDAVYQTALSLSELSARYENAGFCRISKSMAANLYQIASLKSCAAGRIEAAMQNGERLIVSRHYAPLMRQQLGLFEKEDAK